MRPVLFLLLASLVITAGCSADDSPDTDDAPVEEAIPLQVRTTSFPADFLVARIAGDRVERVNLLPVGEDAPFWQPSAEVVASLAEVDLIVANGAGFERWMAAATLPGSRVVDTSAGLELIEIEGRTHSHGARSEHSHAGIDPHTWSDPVGYAQQARAVHDALVVADPDGAEAYGASLATLTGELEALDAAFRPILAQLKARPLTASHPAFNYLARRYGLTVRSFDFDPEEVPDPDALAEFESWADEQEVPVLLWEAPPTEVVTSAFGDEVRHVFVSPLEQPMAGVYDYLAQARTNLRTFDELAASLPLTSAIAP
jgi:zinc transport system substrate-binding protein